LRQTPYFKGNAAKIFKNYINN